MHFTGNDVIDLTKDDALGKSQDLRFIERVFTRPEQEEIRCSSHPDQVLWSLWAAKEAAYKIASKVYPPDPFSHKKFRVMLFHPDRICGRHWSIRGEVCYRQLKVLLKITGREFLIHAVGWAHSSSEEEPNTLISNARRITDQNSNLSENVRRCCVREIAKKLNVNAERLSIVRPVKKKKSSPPELLLDNQRLPIDISLSHHGSWVAWSAFMPQHERLYAEIS